MLPSTTKKINFTDHNICQVKEMSSKEKWVSVKFKCMETEQFENYNYYDLREKKIQSVTLT